MENLNRISQRGKPIWIRIPLIPGHNDSEENLRQVAEFVRPLKAVEKVSLLPYNNLAGAKYQFIRKDYGLEYLAPHPEERMRDFVEIFSCLGMKAELGK